MGDPETEVVIPRIKSDFLELLLATANNDLENAQIEIDEQSATTVMLVAGGYPEAYKKGEVISGTENVSDSLVFHAGTRLNDSNKVVTNGGRVITVSSFGSDFKEALAKSYASIEKIKFDKMNYRNDIGFDL